MKKTVSLLMVLVFALAIVSCNTTTPQEEPHEHEFVLSETDSKKASCTEDGVEVKVCSCGEKQETAIPATGIRYKSVSFAFSVSKNSKVNTKLVTVVHNVNKLSDM